MDEFLDFAAALLDVPRETLTPETAFGSVPAWDSVMHLRLVMETEARFGVPIPLEAVPNLLKLADFAPYLGAGAGAPLRA